MDRILNKCPICGSKLQLSELMQFTRDYTIKKMVGCLPEALNLLIALWKQRLLCVPHVILSQIATENIETMREKYRYTAKMA